MFNSVSRPDQTNIQYEYNSVLGADKPNFQYEYNSVSRPDQSGMKALIDGVLCSDPTQSVRRHIAAD